MPANGGFRYVSVLVRGQKFTPDYWRTPHERRIESPGVMHHVSAGAEVGEELYRPTLRNTRGAVHPGVDAETRSSHEDSFSRYDPNPAEPVSYHKVTCFLSVASQPRLE